MNHTHAFTLIEALIVLAIMSILSLVAVPGLQTILQRGEDDALRADLVRMINFARTEALLYHKTVTFCKSHDAHTCGGEWLDGQIVFIGRAKQENALSAQRILAVNQITAQHGQLHARFYPFYRESIQFNPLLVAITDNGTFWYCHHRALQPSWAIKINRRGMVHVLTPDKNGDIKDQKGKSLSC